MYLKQKTRKFKKPMVKGSFVMVVVKTISCVQICG